MMQVRINVKRKMINAISFLILIFCNISFADDFPASASDGDSQDCGSKCGCDKNYIYDPVEDRCLVNFRKVMKTVVVIYPKSNVDVLADDAMAKALYIEGEKIFQGILISVILFIACASVCIITACIYCCHMNFTDRVLSNDVKALAKKLKRNYNSKKVPKMLPTPRPAISESCNVVVEPAGVFVV